MAFLEISKPKHPYKFGSPDGTRLVYRVVLDDGTLLTLPKLAKKLGFSYTSLSARLQGLPIGTHDDAFWKIVADVRKRSRLNQVPHQKCPHCKGLGKLPLRRLTPEAAAQPLTGDALVVEMIDAVRVAGGK